MPVKIIQQEKWFTEHNKQGWIHADMGQSGPTHPFWQLNHANSAYRAILGLYQPISP